MDQSNIQPQPSNQVRPDVAQAVAPVVPTAPIDAVNVPGPSQVASPSVTTQGPVVINNVYNVAANPILIQRNSGTNIIVRLLWFVFLGWWLGGIVSLVAWFSFVTIIGIPLGLWMVNRLPSIITLRQQEQQWRIEGNFLVKGQVQRSFLSRALYFVLVGWWFSGVWLSLAYLSLVTILLIPLAFWMYGRVGAVTTLYRS